MVKDTIQAIKETEQKAEEIITNAKKEGEQLIEQARQEAVELEAQMTGDAVKAAQAASLAAREKADVKLQDALKEAEEEIRQLKASAKSREEEACVGSNPGFGLKLYAKKEIKEGWKYGSIADAKSQYLRTEKGQESHSGKSTVHGNHGNIPVHGG